MASRIMSRVAKAAGNGPTQGSVLIQMPSSVAVAVLVSHGFAGKIAFVTGASNGIGTATAIECGATPMTPPPDCATTAPDSCSPWAGRG